MLSLYLKEIKSQKFKLISSLVITFFSWSIYFIFSKESITQISGEDGILESLTAIFFFSSSIILLFSNKKHNYFIYALSLILFFGAGEEISWGQRIFGWQTPSEMKKLNVQGETTIHNIEIFNRTKFDNTYKSGTDNFFTMDVLYRIFCVSFGIILPFLVFHFNIIKRLTVYLKIPVPPISLGFLFVISYLFLRFIHVYIGSDMVTKLQTPEIFEFTTSYFWLMISLYFFTIKRDILFGYDIKNSF